MPLKIAPAVLDRLDALVGRTWLYLCRTVYVKGYATEEGSVRIITNKQPIVLKIDSIYEDLKEFLETSDDMEFENKSAVEIYKKESSSFSKLEQIILDNIEKVKADKEFLEQAKEINSNVNTLLKMNQHKIDIFREVRKTKQIG